MRCLIMLLCLSVAVMADLPKEWHGAWKGVLKIPGKDGKVSEVPMSLAIEPIRDSKALTWKIVYGEEPKASVRDYEIVPGDKPGRYLIDEKNGIKIDATLSGKVIHSQFEVQGSRIAARYELRGEELHFEIASAGDAKETGGAGVVPKVKSFPITSVQTAVLKR